MRFGSLFAGIGGLDLGLERAGMECAWQVEIDDYATRVLEKHWPNVRRWRDVRTWPQPDTERVDLLCAGFPCQDISYAGRGAGLEGERSGLFFEAVRVVRQLRPRIVLLENVAALLTRGLDVVLGTLAEIGYDCEWHCIQAADVGAPHIRDRVFVVAHSIQSGLERYSGDGNHRNQSGRDKTESERPVGSPRLCNTASERLLPPAFTGIHSEKAGGGSRHVQPERSDWWKTEPDVGRVADGVSARVDRLRGLGNAVVPQVAEWIGQQILAAEIGEHDRSEN